VTGRTFPIELHYIDGVNRLVAQGQSMQHNKTSSSSNVVRSREEGDVNNGKKASSKGKIDKKKASSGNDNAMDLKPMKFDADLTAELIIRIITVYSSLSFLQEKKDNAATAASSASSASSSSTCGDAILVFLSGVQAIEKVNRALRQRSIVQSMKVQVDSYLD
jgi:HrpA-like RNA helicase